MSALYIMVGIPGSGKSYYCETHQDENAIWVSRDKIRFELLTDGEDYFSKENEVYLKFVDAIQDGLDDGKTVYADATHLTPQSRHKLLNALYLDDTKVFTIYCKTSLKKCIERNRMRTGRARVPDKVIRNMYQIITDPIDDWFADKYSGCVRFENDSDIS